MLRIFEKNSLGKIDKKYLDKYYDRRGNKDNKNAGSAGGSGSAYMAEEHKNALYEEHEEAKKK
jgi:hypothetical protein